MTVYLRFLSKIYLNSEFNPKKAHLNLVFAKEIINKKMEKIENFIV